MSKQFAIEQRKKGELNSVVPKLIPSDNVVNKISILDNRFHQNYKDFKYGNGRPLGYLRWKNIVNTFFTVVSDKIIDSQSGVYLEDLGYFGVMKYPKVPDHALNMMNTYKSMEGGVIYKITFLPIRKDSKFDMWTFESGIARTLERRVYDKVYSRHKYKFIYTLLHGMYSRKVK